MLSIKLSICIIKKKKKRILLSFILSNIISCLQMVDTEIAVNVLQSETMNGGEDIMCNINILDRA